MLLTSSQVSVAISSFVIFIFTTALFLSGYVLQQQTVRDLRAAIKPQLIPTPPELKLYLPPQFRVEGEEGRGIVDAFVRPGDGQILLSNRKGGGDVDVKGEGVEGKSESENGGQGGEEDDMVGATRWQKEARRKKNMENGLRQGADQQSLGLERQETNKNPDDSGFNTDIDGTTNAVLEKKEKPLSRAERRKKIKEEILAAGEGEGYKGYKRRQS